MPIADPDPEPDCTPSFTHVRIAEFCFDFYSQQSSFFYISFSDILNWRLGIVFIIGQSSCKPRPFCRTSFFITIAV
jgi:hypothetical protein